MAEKRMKKNDEMTTMYQKVSELLNANKTIVLQGHGWNGWDTEEFHGESDIDNAYNWLKNQEKHGKGDITLWLDNQEVLTIFSDRNNYDKFDSQRKSARKMKKSDLLTQVGTAMGQIIPSGDTPYSVDEDDEYVEVRLADYLDINGIAYELMDAGFMIAHKAEGRILIIKPEYQASARKSLKKQSIEYDDNGVPIPPTDNEEINQIIFTAQVDEFRIENDEKGTWVVYNIMDANDDYVDQYTEDRGNERWVLVGSVGGYTASLHKSIQGKSFNDMVKAQVAKNRGVKR